MEKGMTLSEAVSELCGRLGVKTKLLPMSNDSVQTVVLSGSMRLGFQEYFVKRASKDRVTGVLYQGCEKAKPAPGILESINQAETVVICPSNPFLSIGPILSIPRIRDSLKRTKARIVAVSPIVGAKALKGPADRIMVSLGCEVSAHGVAEFYKDFLDHMIIDKVDAELKARVAALGVGVTVANTVMKSAEESVSLAREVVGAK
jgi:LPPG:FO 2-phospho-L-lactate transferase